MQMSDEDIEIIENFINKEEPGMEFHEMKAVVKMEYEIYKLLTGKK